MSENLEQLGAQLNNDCQETNRTATLVVITDIVASKQLYANIQKIINDEEEAVKK